LICTVLISQHMGTITALTGIANNAALIVVVEDSKDIWYPERKIAQGLLLSGVIICTPLWLCIILAAPYTLVLLFTVSALAYWLDVPGIKEIRFTELVAGDKSVFGDLLVMMFFLSMLAVVASAMLWFMLALTQVHAWLMLAAFVIEFLVPLGVLAVLLMGLAESSENRAGDAICGMFAPFMTSMSVGYLVSLGVPAAVLAYTSDSGWTGAVPVVFW